MGCCSTNEKSLIVTTINHIWRIRPVHPGTNKFNICSLKSKENMIFAHNFILEKHKQTKQLVDNGEPTEYEFIDGDDQNLS